MIQVTPTTRGPGVTKEETKGSGGGGGGGAESVQQRRGFDLQVRGQRGGGERWGWRGGWSGSRPRSPPLFGLADFKRDRGIPGRQKNSGPGLGSQSKITHVFISGRQGDSWGLLAASRQAGAPWEGCLGFAPGRGRALRGVGLVEGALGMGHCG